VHTCAKKNDPRLTEKSPNHLDHLFDYNPYKIYQILFLTCWDTEKFWLTCTYPLTGKNPGKRHRVHKSIWMLTKIL